MPEAKDTLPYRVLARKYRPVDFTTLVGQEAMVRTLRNAIATGRIAHAFMLTGVRGVGKTTTARIIARALNCVGKDGKGGATVDPCGVCDNCKAITEDRHVDVIEMAVLGDGLAVVADAAGIDGGAALAVLADAVQRPGDDARGRGLADTAHAREHEGMGDAARRDGVAQGAHHRLLANQGGEIDRTVFAGEDPIGKLFLGFRHGERPTRRRRGPMRPGGRRARPPAPGGGARLATGERPA